LCTTERLGVTAPADAVAAVAKLKRELDGELVIYAICELGQALIEHDVVDELRLFVFPILVGAGRHLFGETTDEKTLRLIDTNRVGDGFVFLTYELIHLLTYAPV
jgi:dihydrofolate reductase